MRHARGRRRGIRRRVKEAAEWALVAVLLVKVWRGAKERAA